MRSEKRIQQTNKQTNVVINLKNYCNIQLNFKGPGAKNKHTKKSNQRRENEKREEQT